MGGNNSLTIISKGNSFSGSTIDTKTQVTVSKVISITFQDSIGLVTLGKNTAGTTDKGNTHEGVLDIRILSPLSQLRKNRGLIFCPHGLFYNLNNGSFSFKHRTDTFKRAYSPPHQQMGFHAGRWLVPVVS